MRSAFLLTWTKVFRWANSVSDNARPRLLGVQLVTPSDLISITRRTSTLGDAVYARSPQTGPRLRSHPRESGTSKELRPDGE